MHPGDDGDLGARMRASLTPAEPLPRFGSASMLWRVGGEPAMFFGGQRALLLQLAHPKVGAGVEHHSSFRRHPIIRLWGTLDTLLLLVWGNVAEATAARNHIFGIHDRVHGRLGPDGATSGHPATSEYSAHDPELLHWVWSTLVDSAEVVYSAFIRPLSPPEAEALYADWCALARLMGIPDDHIHASRDEFRVDFDTKVAALDVSAASRHVADAVLDPPVPLVPGIVKERYALLAAGLLPLSVRNQYGLMWGPRQQADFDRTVGRIGAAWRATPTQRRQLPVAYLVARRAATAALARVPGGRRVPVLGSSIV